MDTACPGHNAARKEHRHDQTPDTTVITAELRRVSAPGRLANPAAAPEAETHLVLFIRATPITIFGGNQCPHSQHNL